MAREGHAAASMSYLPKLSQVSEDAVAALKTKVVNKQSLTQEEDEMVRQCKSEMGRERKKKNWLRTWQPDITEEQIENELHGILLLALKLHITSLQIILIFSLNSYLVSSDAGGLNLS